MDEDEIAAIPEYTKFSDLSAVATSGDVGEYADIALEKGPAP